MYFVHPATKYCKHFQKRFRIEKKVLILSIHLKKSFQQVFFINTDASFAQFAAIFKAVFSITKKFYPDSTHSDICINYFQCKNRLNEIFFSPLTGEGAAVLLHGIDPVDGIDHMQKIRSQKTLKEKDLCNGPSKLCQALKISKDKFNKVDMKSSDEIWLEDGEDLPQTKIVTGARINIDYAEEWAQKPLRFYILGNKSVSKRDKAAEDSLSRV